MNASASITGRYPNLGPLLIAAAGIPLLDDVGADVMAAVAEGRPVTVDGDHVVVAGHKIASGTRQTMATLEELVAEARQRMGDELERFAQNTLEYLRKEGRLLTDVPEVPDVGLDLKGRHVLIVVRGVDYKDDLALLRRTGYLRELKPVLIGVDGGADALLEIGAKPDVIIGDFDSVSERALRCGATLVVHAYAGGNAPGADRLDRLGLDFIRFESPGTSEDIAMLLAFEQGAELIVAVGTHSSMVDFLDKGRAGMASTFLVRMKVGPILVDAKGVSRLYRPSVKRSDLLLMVAAATVALAVIIIVSEPIRLLIRALWVSPHVINLRYHIVSITAVFLALAIGIAVGTTFIDKATISTLRDRLDGLEERVRDTEADNSALQDDLAELDRTLDLLGEQGSARFLGGHLDGVPVMILATRGVDEDSLDRCPAGAPRRGRRLRRDAVAHRAARARRRQRSRGPGRRARPGRAATPERLHRALSVRLAGVLMTAARTEADGTTTTTTIVEPVVAEEPALVARPARRRLRRLRPRAGRPGRPRRARVRRPVRRGVGARCRCRRRRDAVAAPGRHGRCRPGAGGRRASRRWRPTG